MKSRLITVFGASGFVGGYVVKRLAKQGYLVRAAVRDPSGASFLKPMGDVGQVTPVQANIRNKESIIKVIDGSDGVINLVGIFRQIGKQRFDAVHCRGAKNVAQAAADIGSKFLVHVSALGASLRAPSMYSKTKAAGEKAVKEAFPNATIIRPSVVFGPQDDFFNRLAALACFTPVMPVLGCPHPKYNAGKLDFFGNGGTLFQPVYAGDVADAIVQTIENDAFKGKVCELAGPEVLSFKELIEKILHNTGRRNLLIPVPFRLASIVAFFAELLPVPPLTRDQIILLKNNSVLDDGANGFLPFNITPTSVDVMLPSYLDKYCKGGRFSRFSGA